MPGSCKSFSDWCLKLHAAVCVFAYAAGSRLKLGLETREWKFMMILKLPSIIHTLSCHLAHAYMYVHTYIKVHMYKCTYNRRLRFM